MYCDQRIFGVERWTIQPPADASMWLPHSILRCASFLCVKHEGRTLYGGTAFLVAVEDHPSNPDLTSHYLVTAKHCVERAFSRYGNLHCRVNLEEKDKTRLITLPSISSWEFSDSADIAVLPMPHVDDKVEMDYLPTECFFTDATLKEHFVGLGDELFIVGLFTQRYGTKKNIPIVRFASIAAMPEEPLIDNSGQEYSAYLIEARSIGGLSGSPVFMAMKKRGVVASAARGFHPWTHSIFALGLIRGHWDMVQSSALDFLDDSDSKLNMGIAIVTPIQEVYNLLMGNERLVALRKKKIKEYRREHAPTLDSGLPEHDQFTQSDFESALRKASRRIEPSESDAKKK